MFNFQRLKWPKEGKVIDFIVKAQNINKQIKRSS